MVFTSSRIPAKLPTESPAPPGPASDQEGQDLTRLRGARFWMLPLGGFGLTAILALALLVLPADVRATLGGMAQLVGMAAAAICSAVVLRLKAPILNRRTKWGWRCISIALFSYTLGNAIIAAISTSVQNSTAIVTPADGFIIPFYPLLLTGAALLPSTHPSWSRQLRSILDALIAVGAILGIGLVVLIVPRYNGHSLSDYIYVLYPVLDFTGLVVLLMLLIRGKQRPYFAVCFWLMVGMLILSYADSLFNYLTLPVQAGGAGYYADQAFAAFYIAPAYLAGPLAFCLAALQILVQRDQPGPGWGWLERLTARFSSIKATSLREQLVVLFLPVTILGSLLIYSQIRPQAIRIPLLALICLTLVVVGFIIVRQLLTTRDLVDAHTAREQAEQLDALKDQFITSINHELRTPFQILDNFLTNITDLEALRATLEQRGTLRQQAMWAYKVMNQLLLNLRAQARRELVTQPIYAADLVRSAEICVQIIQALQQEGQANEQLTILLKHATEASAALRRIITNILDVRRYDQASIVIDPQVVSVLQTVQDVLLVNQGQRQISVRISDRLSVWGEATYFYEILNNLVTNAIKYSPSNAHIWITAYLMSSKGRPTGTGDRAGGKMVEIVVRDNGFGIPPDQLPLLFNRFVRLPRDLASTREGTGLGLYLCKVFSEAMSGQIWAESKGENQGSAFHLRLPAASPPVVQSQERRSTSQRHAALRQHVPLSGMEQRSF
jgi:signal transduction histidine kinase